MFRFVPTKLGIEELSGDDLAWLGDRQSSLSKSIQND
jgi:hypothetical protein